LQGLAEQRLTYIASFAYSQLTAEPTQIYLDRNGSTIQQSATLVAGYGGMVAMIVMIDTEITQDELEQRVVDQLGESAFSLYTEYGAATTIRTIGNITYLVVILGGAP
jgi:hypothetical protein